MLEHIQLFRVILITYIMYFVLVVFQQIVTLTYNFDLNIPHWSIYMHNLYLLELLWRRN